MAYIKTVWENGDVITKEKLNNIENGITNAGGGLVTTFTTSEDGYTDTLDASYNDIKGACLSGKAVYLAFSFASPLGVNYDIFPIYRLETRTIDSGPIYLVSFIGVVEDDVQTNYTFTAKNPDDPLTRQKVQSPDDR